MAKIPDDMQRRMEMIKQAQESLAAYNDLLRATKELEDNISYVEAKRLQIQKNMLDAQGELRAYEEGHISLTADQVNELKKKAAALEYALSIEEKTLEAARDELRIRKEAIAEVNKLNLALNSTYNITKKLGEQVLKQTGYWLDQQKGVKETELSMGILSNQSKGFRNNIYQTSISTTQIGVNTKELAKLQGTYADNVGRAVQLNEGQLQAVAEIGKGTMLGSEAAAELAAQFESIGIGAEGTADYVEETLQLATEMGISASKTMKNIQKNFRLLNKYNFQGGVEGFGKMAALATKFKFEMESIAGFADDLMTPEGAVEVASKLQVLGGEWAKLGDPFELMYRSRNDLAGLTEDILNATKATATFDETTGEFRISPMELHRLREVANVTGMNAEELAEMAKQTAKFDRIESLIPATFSKEDKEYLSSLATFDKKTGKYKIQLQTESGDNINENVDELKKITPELIKAQRKFDESLEERAKQAMTFNERFNALVESFKSGLLPAFEEVATILEKAIAWAEPFVKGVADFMAEWPKTTAAIGSFLAGMALIGDELMWFVRGQLLGKGFNTTANPMGGGGGGLGKGLGGKLFGGMTKGGGLKGFGGNIGKGLGSVGAIGGGLLAAGISGYDEWTENKEAGMDTGENIGRTALRGGGAGLGGWGGAAAGAAIGTAIFPGIGTVIGGLIGGGLGAWGGGSLGDMAGDAAYGESQPREADMFNDFIMRPNQEPMSFSADDTVVGAKEGGPLDKMISAFQDNEMVKPSDDISIDLDDTLIEKGEGNAVDKVIKALESNNIAQQIPFDSFTKRLRGIIAQDTGEGNVDFNELISTFQNREQPEIAFDSLSNDLKNIINESATEPIDYNKLGEAVKTDEPQEIPYDSFLKELRKIPLQNTGEVEIDYGKIANNIKLEEQPDTTSLFTKELKNIMQPDTSEVEIDYSKLGDTIKLEEQLNFPFDSFSKQLKGIVSQDTSESNLDIDKIVKTLESDNVSQQIPFDSFTKQLRNVVSKDTGEGNIDFEKLINSFQSTEQVETPYNIFSKDLKDTLSQNENPINYDEMASAIDSKEQLDVVTEVPSISIDLNDSLVSSKNILEYDKISEALRSKEIPEAVPGNNVVSIDSNEALIGVKSAAEFDRLFESQSPATTQPSGVEVVFKDPIKIEGKIEVASGDQRKEIDLEDPILMQNLSRMIMEQLSKNVGGGKIASNPTPA